MNCPTRLRMIRKSMGLSQSLVERMLGITHGLYSMLEQGRLTQPYPYIERVLEEFFGFPIEILLQPTNVAYSDQKQQICYEIAGLARKVIEHRKLQSAIEDFIREAERFIDEVRQSG